jgi:hypothetical protein
MTALLWLWVVSLHGLWAWLRVLAVITVIAMASWMFTRWYDGRHQARLHHRQFLQARDELEFYAWMRENEEG